MARSANALQAAQAVSILGLEDEVAALGRVICEAGIQLSWIRRTNGLDNSAQVATQRAQDLLDANNIEAERNARLWAAQEFGSIEAAKALAARLEGIARRRREGQLPARPTPTLADQAVAAGPDVAAGYDLWFRTLCDAAHASVWASASALHQQSNDETHARTLFICLSCALQVSEEAFFLLGRKAEHEALVAAVTQLPVIAALIEPASA